MVSTFKFSKLTLWRDFGSSDTWEIDMAYDDKNFLDGLEWLWGAGFLSPGGPEEVSEILRGTDIQGKSVMDFGCGIGGIDQLLVNTHGAAKVTGLDVVQSLIERARADAEKLGLSSRVEYLVADSDELQFADESFDVVFTKDTVVHIADKPKVYEEFFRILRKGGVLAGSDWLGSENTASSERVAEWLDFSQLDFHFCMASELHDCLGSAGFESIKLRDRNAWYRRAVRDEIERVSGETGREYAQRFGQEQANYRRKSSTLKRIVVDAGELRPTLFRAAKPVD